MFSATRDALGSDKWSLGSANVRVNAENRKFQWGYLLTSQASVAGDGDRADVNIAALQPFLSYRLGEGWHLRSEAVDDLPMTMQEKSGGGVFAGA